MEQVITCINCPVGCRMTVTLTDGKVTAVAGNTCKRGETYARQECVDPQRMVTAVIPVEGASMPVSVKTRTPISKKLIRPCMRALSEVHIAAPVRAGQVVLADVCGTGVDVIATKSVP